MIQPLQGVASVIRVIRSSLGIVALALVLPVVFSLVIFLFAPLPNLAKYIIGGAPWALVLIVWFQFWRKAKNEPLNATETYYIAQLMYRYLGSQQSPTTAEKLLAEPLQTASAQPELPGPTEVEREQSG